MSTEMQKKVAAFIGFGLLAVIVGTFLFIGAIGLGSASYLNTGGKGGAMGYAMGGFFFLVALGGLFSIGWGIAIGLQEAFGDDRKKPIENASGVLIIAKLVLDSKNDTVYDPDMYDEDEIQRLVQVQFANGRKEEFKASLTVFDTIGEGMKGKIIYQGKWLSSFEMEIQPGGERYTGTGQNWDNS